MSAIRWFFSRLRKERGITYEKLGETLAAAAGDDRIKGRTRIGAWFSREGIPTEALGAMCEVFGVTREEAIREMDDEDLLRYESFILEPPRLARLLREFGERSLEEQDRILDELSESRQRRAMSPD